MITYSSAEERARQVLAEQSMGRIDANWVLDTLRDAGFRLADEQRDELVCRWVNVLERAVPQQADTIIRTITRTLGGQASSTTHWLDGLRSPRA